jgi:hypothetical protein
LPLRFCRHVAARSRQQNPWAVGRWRRFLTVGFRSARWPQWKLLTQFMSDRRISQIKNREHRVLKEGINVISSNYDKIIIFRSSIRKQQNLSEIPMEEVESQITVKAQKTLK